MTAAERGPLRVVGRYALYNEIAAGGMATVHIGRLLGPVGFARTVAVKRLHPQFAKDPEFVSMFLDEARLAARVQHPNVVATIDVVATDGELFLIMDYVRGESLSRLVRSARKAGQRVPPRIANAIMCGFLHGLHSAHEAKNERGEPINLIHRDVSPQNVLVGSDGIARVLDFGIAKAAGRIQVTRDGQIKGKLAYMPPEQLAGRELTRGVDIYASAVVMWETLTGERLFKGETEAETLAKILRDPVVPPTTVVPALPKAFDAALLRALSRDASKRQATARELALDFERCSPMASPTEVGEWVEAMVGPTLNAREDQIAEIESNSAGLRVSPSGRPEPETRSDSDFAAIPIASAPTSTLLGVGPPSGAHSLPRAPSSHQIVTSAPSDPLAHLSESDARRSPTFRASQSDDYTGSKSQLTGTALHLPVDRRLPLIASAAGVLVLLVILGVVIAGKGSASQLPIAAVDAGVNVAANGANAANVNGRPIPPPEPTTAPMDPAPPPTTESAPAAPEPTPKPTAAPTPKVAPIAPTPRVTTPKATAAPPPPPAVKKSCDPPFTIDANGRKKYKLECM